MNKCLIKGLQDRVTNILTDKATNELKDTLFCNITLCGSFKNRRIGGT